MKNLQSFIQIYIYIHICIYKLKAGWGWVGWGGVVFSIIWNDASTLEFLKPQGCRVRTDSGPCDNKAVNCRNFKHPSDYKFIALHSPKFIIIHLQVQNSVIPALTVFLIVTSLCAVFQGYWQVD